MMLMRLSSLRTPTRFFSTENVKPSSNATTSTSNFDTGYQPTRRPVLPTPYLRLSHTNRFTARFDIQELLRKYIVPRELHQSYGSLGTPEGIWWVRYSTREEAEKAKQMIDSDRPVIGMRPLKALYVSAVPLILRSRIKF